MYLDEQNLLYFIILIVFLLIVVIYLLISKKEKKDNTANQMMLTLLTDLRGEVNNSGSQNRQLLQERLDNIIHQISNHQQNTSQHLFQQHDSSTHLIKDISSKLSQIENTNQQILGFANQMQSLERILQNPKQRGILGEYFLDALLTNVLQPKQFKMQYRFSNGEIVDAAIFFRQQIIPIDAKFSLEKYNLMMQVEDIHQKRQLEKAFKSDIKKRIEETAKYIRPNEQTTDFAMMFIPAEGIYHHLLNYQVGSQSVNSRDLIAYAFSKKVIIVSPTTFYAYLQTILHGLKALQIEDSIKDVIKKVNDLGKHLNSYESHLNKMGNHLGTTVSMYNQANKSFKQIDTDIFKITEGEQGGDFEADVLDKPKEIN